MAKKTVREIGAANGSYFDTIFEGINLADTAISKTEFEKCIFRKCSFINMELRDCRFSECVFEACVLSAVKPINSSFNIAAFIESKTIAIDWTRTRKISSLKFDKTQLDFCNFRFIKLPGVKITESSAKECDFIEADISGGDFRKSDMEKTVFFKTNLEKADFRDAVNYFIDPLNNKVKGSKFSFPEAANLLKSLEIEVEY